MKYFRHRILLAKYSLLLLASFSTGISELAFSQSSPQDPLWSGSAQCQLTVQTASYSHQEIQIWTITGQPKLQGALEIYPGTWSVIGRGERQDVQGTQTAKMQWNVAVPPMEATFAIFVRASDNQIIIKSYHSQLRANNAVTGARLVTLSGAPQKPAPIVFGEYEWPFPAVQDIGASISVSGSTSTPLTGGIGPMQPAGLPGTAVCTWKFTKGGSAAASPLLTQRISRLSNSLTLSAKSWVAQQAQATAQASQPDVPQIKAQVRARFASTNGEMPAGADVQSITAVVLTQANDQIDQNMQQLTSEMK
ncbi:MAG TPA: hypothetical protein VGK36_11250, partial [Candidatus Angelobacter sp.]